MHDMHSSTFTQYLPQNPLRLRQSYEETTSGSSNPGLQYPSTSFPPNIPSPSPQHFLRRTQGKPQHTCDLDGYGCSGRANSSGPDLDFPGLDIINLAISRRCQQADTNARKKNIMATYKLPMAQ